MSWISYIFEGKSDDSLSKPKEPLLELASQWGKDRAIVILNMFNSCHASHPEMPKKELYYTTLNGIGLTETIAHQIVDDAADIAEGNMGFGITLPSLKESFGLRSVVKHLLIYEEFQRFGFEGYPHPLGIPEAFSAVDAVIAKNI